MFERYTGYHYYSVRRDQLSVESVWDWVSEEGNCYMWKTRVIGGVIWIAQIPSGSRNTLFALRYSDCVDLL